MKGYRFTTAAVLVAALGVGTAALAQGPRGGGPGGPGRGHGRAAFAGVPAAALNLTQAQQDLIRDIRERNSTERRQLATRLREAHAAQQKAIDAIPVDEAAIRTATLAAAEVQADAAVLQARARGEIFNALTPEQQAQFKKLQAEREQRMQERRSRMQQRRQGPPQQQ